MAADEPTGEAERSRPIGRTPADASRPPLPPGEPVLAHWVYAPEEWSSYARSEVKRRTVEWIAVGAGLFGIGLLGSGREGGAAALVSASAVAAAIVAGRLVMARRAYRQSAGQPGEVIITPTAILLGNRRHVLSDEAHQLEGVEFDLHAQPPRLEFTVGSGARSSPGSERGRTRDRIRVPVPAGREAEARQVLAAIERSLPPPT